MTEKEARVRSDVLLLKLGSKAAYVSSRYAMYEQDYLPRPFPTIVPEKFRQLIHVMGWATKSVNMLSDRVVFEKFGNDIINANQIWDYNDGDVLSDSLVLSALISSCSFIYISADADGYPRLQAIDGSRATGVIDPQTHMLSEGVAVLERDSLSLPTKTAYFTPEETFVFDNEGNVSRYDNPTGFPLLVPVCHRPSEVKPFGRSRITPASIGYIHDAALVLMRTHCAGEFYAFPQKYALGLSSEVEFDEAQATMAAFLKVTQDENGEKPTFGQFQQASMTPYIDELRSKAALFAGENDMTIDDLGFSTDNPATRESIEAAHESLRMSARKAQRSFGSGFKNAAFLAACLRDGRKYGRQIMADITCEWRPIFEPSPSSLSGIGDAVTKIQQAFPDYFTEDKLHRMTGM